MESLIAPVSWLAATAAAATVAAFLYGCWRTQSLHFIVRRFWAVVHGHKAIPDPVIHAFAQEQTSLYAFRLFSGVQALSLAQAHQILAWCAMHRIPMQYVRSCGEDFDLDKCALHPHKLPRPWWRWVFFTYTVALVLLAFGSVVAAVNAPGIVAFKETQRHFVLREKSAHLLWTLPWARNAIDIGDCQANNQRRFDASGFSPVEIPWVCKILTAPEYKDYVTSLHQEQAWSFVFLVGSLILAVWMNVQTLHRWHAYRTIAEKLAALPPVPPWAPGALPVSTPSHAQQCPSIPPERC